MCVPLTAYDAKHFFLCLFAPFDEVSVKIGGLFLLNQFVCFLVVKLEILFFIF